MGEPRHIKGYDLLKGEEGNWKRFFFDKSDLTFLVGAGISINPPSNLMPARGMMEAVLKFGADPAIVGKLLTIPELRYEYLIQEFRDKYDPDLVILDYFEECTQPNVIHTFLARMINLGHFVMTTNFDTLIERAVGLDNPSLQIVITRKDFEKYGDPQANWKKGLRIVYKLHGSKINAKTGEDTRESVIITLDGLGKRKDGDFSVEMFKKPLFLRIVVGRTLIIMGYSGGDDFDIVPTMTQLSGLKRVIWISHDEVVKDPVIYRLNHASVSSAEEKIGWCNEDNLLYTIYRTTGAEVIKIVGNTSSLVAELNDTPHLISQTSVKRDFFNWLLDNFPPPSAEHRTFFTARIFHNYQFSQEALLYYQKTLEISQKSNNFSLLASALNNMGLVYSDIGEPQKALEHFQKSHESYRQINNQKGISASLSNMGRFYAKTGNPQKALEYFQKSHEINERIDDPTGMSTTLNNIGVTYMDLGKPSEALEKLQQSYEIDRQIGDWAGMGTVLSVMGSITKYTGDQQKALDYLQKSYSIFDRLGNWAGMGTALSNMAFIYMNTGKSQKALEHLQQAYEIYERINNQVGIGIALGNMGIIYDKMQEPQQALEYLQKSYEIHEQLEDMGEASRNLLNMGTVYIRLRKPQQALKYLQKSHEIDKRMDNKAGIARNLWNMGLVYRDIGEPQQALEYLQNSHELLKQLGFSREAAIVARNIEKLESESEQTKND